MGSDTQLPTIGSDSEYHRYGGRHDAGKCCRTRTAPLMCCAWPYIKTGDRRQRRTGTQSTAPTASSMPFAVGHLVSAPIQADHLSKNTRRHATLVGSTAP